MRTKDDALIEKMAEAIRAECYECHASSQTAMECRSQHPDCECTRKASAALSIAKPIIRDEALEEAASLADDAFRDGCRRDPLSPTEIGARLRSLFTQDSATQTKASKAMSAFETTMLLIDYGLNPGGLMIPETCPGYTIDDAVADVLSGAHHGRLRAVYSIHGDKCEDVSEEVVNRIAGAWVAGQFVSKQAREFVDYCGCEVREEAA